MTKEVAAGMSYAINATLLTTKNMTAITGATEAVATLEASHGIAQGEVAVILTTGWGRLKHTIFRAKTVSVNDVTLEGIDTTNTIFFPSPPSTGAGTVAEIDATAWKELTEVDAEGTEVSGGERATQTLTPLNLGGRQVAHPTTESPFVWTIPFYENAGAETWYATAKAASENGTYVALRVQYPSGFRMYAYCKVALQRAPNQSGFNVPTSRIVLMAQGDITRLNT